VRAHTQTGTQQQYRAAAAYHLAAAEGESGDVAFELNVLYATDSGVPADELRSHSWALLAGASGAADASHSSTKGLLQARSVRTR
jgi:TPR repeat protein